MGAMADALAKQFYDSALAWLQANGDPHPNAAQTAALYAYADNRANFQLAGATPAEYAEINTLGEAAGLPLSFISGSTASVPTGSGGFSFSQAWNDALGDIIAAVASGGTDLADAVKGAGDALSGNFAGAESELSAVQANLIALMTKLTNGVIPANFLTDPVSGLKSILMGVGAEAVDLFGPGVAAAFPAITYNGRTITYADDVATSALLDPGSASTAAVTQALDHWWWYVVAAMKADAAKFDQVLGGLALDAPPPSYGADTYVWADGDTESGVALDYGVSTADLESANPGVDFTTISAGTSITIPGDSPVVNPNATPQAQSYTWADGDTEASVASAYGISASDLEAANPSIQDWSDVATGTEISIPVPAPATGNTGSDILSTLSAAFTLVKGLLGNAWSSVVGIFNPPKSKPTAPPATAKPGTGTAPLPGAGAVATSTNPLVWIGLAGAVYYLFIRKPTHKDGSTDPTYHPQVPS